MGLGLHGGGGATARWLVRNGARVTVTDTRDAKVLAPSLRALKGLPMRLVLGRHRTSDFRSHDLIVVNPGVPRESLYLRVAKNAGKKIENDASLFFRFLQNPVIAVTGTRGKTTTTLWVAELLKKKYPAVRQSGTPEHAEFKEFERIQGKNIPAVVELSSWQLEYLPQSDKAPRIAAVTNIYPEHLNRYRNIKAYADAKANIFLHQRKEDMLVLNYDNLWYRYFLKKKPKSTLYYISKKTLPKKLNGAYVKNGKMILRGGGKEQALFFVTRFRKERGEHSLENLLRAVLMAKLFDPTVAITERDILHLPIPRMRQEVVYKRGRLTIVNDSCATSPEGTIAAIERFKGAGSVVLITGGTDKDLEFAGLAAEIKRHIPVRRLILLGGSATQKLKKKLMKIRYGVLALEYSTLKECVAKAIAVAGVEKRKTVILFSPGAASFEKFLHEFDRGSQFNRLVRRSI